MVGLHNVVGTLVLLGYLAATVLYALWARGRPVPAIRVVSGIAAALLLVQYLIGFWLLADDHDGRGLHYVLALAAVLTVGLEHGYARTRATAREQATLGAVAAGLTLALVAAAYAVGSS